MQGQWKRGREYRELGERRVEIHSNEFVFVLQAAHVSVDVREGVSESVCVPVLSICLHACVHACACALPV